MNDVILKVGGQRYGGWKEIMIQRSIEQIAGQFSLNVSERWSGQDNPRPIYPGDACEVLVDNEPIITGYVDDVDVDYDATNHSVTISGRDRAGDLVDCSAPSKQYQNQDLESLAKKLCKPFSIEVSSEVSGLQRLRFIDRSEGESIFDVLDAAAKLRAVRFISDGKGGIVITRAGRESLGITLALGESILSCQAAFSMKDRFSRYEVKGQQPANDEAFGPDSTSPVGVAIDESVKRFRPITINAAGLVNFKIARDQAQWERNVRFGRSQRQVYTVQGWNYAPGKVWPINRTVRVTDSYLSFEAVERLIVGVNLSISDRGTTTQLTLMPPAAFDLVSLPEKDAWESL